MLDRDFSKRFAKEWIDSWNSHDLERILSHYDDQFEMTSPFIASIAKEASGKLQGKKKVGTYWKQALQMIPDLRFELISTLTGVNSITLYYKGAQERLSAEVLHFGPNGKVIKAFAHYAG